MESKVWYITGASKGLGLTLVKKLLSAGNKVAATSRNSAQFLIPELSNTENFLPLQVDLTDEKSIEASVETTIKKFGRIDVVVNNAGYGIGGALEELTAIEIAQSVQINLYATIYVIQKTLPYLRKQGSGHILNIASIAGFAAGIGWSAYAASKYGVIGLSESLAQDVKEFGIHVTAIAPGAFRTEFLTSDSIVFAKKSISDYKEMKAGHQKLMSYNGKQVGDPEMAAEAMITLTKSSNPPQLLFLGSDAYNRASAKIDLLKKEMDEWKDLTFSTDF